MLGHDLAGRDRLAGGLEHGFMSAAAGLVAYLPTQALGLREGFWAVITAIAVVQNQFGATRSTALDQFTGAAIGGTITVVVDLATGQHLASYALAVVASIVACWMLHVASAARLAGTTATIILLVPHQGTVQAMLVSRFAEVAWGVAVAVSVVWLVSRIGAGRKANPDP